MNKEQTADAEILTNAIYKALVMFNKHQMENMGEIMEKVGDGMTKALDKIK